MFQGSSDYLTMISPRGGGAGAPDYRMVDAIEIKNFRSLRSVNLQDLRRINVIAGQSGTGKTALLEALFLGCGASLELYMRIRRWRGFPDVSEVSGSELNEAIWRDLVSFPDASVGHAKAKSRDDSSSIQLHDNAHGTRVLRISRNTSQGVLFDPKSEEQATAPVRFVWTFGKQSHESFAEVTKEGLRIPPGGKPVPVIFLTPVSLYHRENVKRFSALSRRGAHRPIAEAMRKVFSSVNDLSIEMDMGQATLYASLDDVPEKVPLPSVSAGLTKYLSIALAIVSQPRGVVLIDEIENGFHFSSLEPALRSLVDLAREHETQLFVTTHSDEFLKTVAVVMEADPASFSLIRSERSGLNSTLAVTRAARAVAAVANSEVR